MSYRHENSCLFAPDEAGTAILELTIVIGIFLLFFVNILDLGQIVSQYLRLTHIAYEGARYGASLAGVAALPGDALAQATAAEKLEKIRTRVLDLAEHSKFSRIMVSVDAEYNSTTVPAPVDGVTAPYLKHSVTVRVRMPYQPIFMAFANIRISASATAPYLFEEPSP